MRKFSTSGVGFTLANPELWPAGKMPPTKKVMTAEEARQHLAEIDKRVVSTKAALDASLDALMNLFEAMDNQELDETLGLLLLKPADRSSGDVVYDEALRAEMLASVRQYIEAEPNDFARRCKDAATKHPKNKNVAAAHSVASVLQVARPCRRSSAGTTGARRRAPAAQVDSRGAVLARARGRADRGAGAQARGTR